MITFKKSSMKYKNADGTMKYVDAIMGSEVTDITLSKSGVAADAKEVGSRFSEVEQGFIDQLVSIPPI